MISLLYGLGIHTQREEAVDYVVSSAAAGALAIVS